MSRNKTGGLITGGELPACERVDVMALGPSLSKSGPDEMAKAQELQDLLQAEAHLAEADACIEKQRAIIEKLASDGHPTETAEQLLATMLHSRDAFEAHRRIISKDSDSTW